MGARAAANPKGETGASRAHARSPSRASFLNAHKAYAVSDKSAGHKEHSKQRTVWRTCCGGVFGVLRSFGGQG